MVSSSARPPASQPRADAEGERRTCAHDDIGDQAPHDWQAVIDRVVELRHADPAGCVAFAKAAGDAAREHAAAAAEMQISYYVGFALHILGRNGEAYTANMVTLRQARALGDVQWEGRALNGLGTVFASIADYATAIGYYDQALEIHRRLADARGEAAVLNNLGEVYRAMGGFEGTAVDLYRQSRDLFRDLGLSSAVMVTNMALAEFARHQRLAEADPAGAAEAAIRAHEMAEQAVREADGAMDLRMTVAARLVLAETELTLHRPEPAQAHIAAAQSLLSRHSDPQLEIDYRIGLARLRRFHHEDHAAIEILREALLLCDEHVRKPDRLTVLRDLEDALESIGDLAGALQTFREFHRATIELRDQETERRIHVAQARMDVERIRYEAELERLRSAHLEQQNLLLSRLAQEDDLTGLLNRRALESVLQARLDPWSGRPFACALADLDHFKEVNDRYSHQVGDEVLRQFGLLMRQSLSSDDIAVRYGGEEFAILIADPDRRDPVEVCEQLRRAIEGHSWAGVRDGLVMTVSIGATPARSDDTLASLLARADALLYSAKSKGRNRVEFG